MQLTHQPKGLRFFLLFGIPSSNDMHAGNEWLKAKKKIKMFIINILLWPTAHIKCRIVFPVASFP